MCAARDPLVIVLATVNFPHDQHVPRLSCRIQRDPRLYIIYSYFYATAGFYREMRYSFRIPPGEQLACPPSCFFSVFFFPYALPFGLSLDSTISCFQHGKRRLRKILSTGSPSLSPTTELFARVSFSPLSLPLSHSRAAFGKHRVLCKQLRRLYRAYLNCLHKQLVELLKLKILRRSEWRNTAIAERNHISYVTLNIAYLYFFKGN